MTDLVLLHGTGGTKDELEPLVAQLSPDVTCWTMNLLGHGGRPVPSTLDIDEIVDDLLRGLDAAGVRPAYFFGYSGGGPVALNIAARYPQRVLGCCVLSAKWIYDENVVEQWSHVLSPQRKARLGIVQPDWVDRLDEVRREWLGTIVERGYWLNEEFMAAIARPVLILNGSRDPVVGVEEARRMALSIPNSRLAVFEGRAHPFADVPLDATAQQIRQFIRDVEASEPSGQMISR